MIHVTLQEFRALYANYYVHAFNGKILYKLFEFERPVLSGGAAHLTKLDENKNVVEKISIKIGKDGEVSLFEPAVKKFMLIGRLVSS